MTVLVTGGAGYIGAHTVRLLRARGRAVVVLDDLSMGHPAAVQGTPLVVGDVADGDLVRRVVEEHGVDAVIHFAASKAAGESMTDPGKYFRNNTAGTIALLDTVQRAGIERFVFSSTAAVYGTPASVPIDEQADLHPENAYGESKLLVERVLRWFDERVGFRSVVLRYFNAAGASADSVIGEDFSMTLNLVPVLMKVMLQGGRLQVFGADYPTPDGTAIRDYIHVEDLAEAHLAALEHLERGGASVTLNLGTGVGSSVLEVIESVRRASGRDLPYDVADRRPGDPAVLIADATRASDVLGWRAQRDLDEIVDSAWRWHRDHPDGYGPAREGVA